MSSVDFNLIYRDSIPKDRLDCYSFYLKHIHFYLNYIHRENKDIHYWELLIGPWLMNFIWNVDYRLINDSSLSKQKNILSYTPYDTQGSLEIFDNKDYINYLHNLSKNTRNNQKKIIIFFKKKDESIFKIIMKKIILIILNLFSKRAEIYMVAPYINILDQLKVFFNSKFKILPFYFISKINKINKININLRQWNSDNILPNSKLEKFIYPLVLNQIPYIFVEGYEDFNLKQSKLPINLQAIYASVGWQKNEELKFFAANNYNSIKIIGSQHGGHPYGTGLNPIIHLEMRLVDVFLTWGWKQSIKDEAFQSTRISIQNNNLKKNKNLSSKKILYISTCGNSYEPNGFGSPGGNDWHSYKKFRECSLNFLRNRFGKNIIFRPHPGEDLNKFNTIKKIKFDRSKSLYKSLYKYNFIILDNILTVFFEIIAYDQPLVVIMKKDLWTFNSEFQKTIVRLEKVGLIHYNIKSIEKFLHHYNDDLNEWWNSETIQVELNLIKKLFINTSKTPIKDLVKKLNRITLNKNIR